MGGRAPHPPSLCLSSASGVAPLLLRDANDGALITGNHVMGCGSSSQPREPGAGWFGRGLSPQPKPQPSGSFVSDAAPDSRRKRILRETFDALDSDGNGYVDRSEFLAGSKENSSERDVLTRLFSFIDDTDAHDGKITFAEWQVMGEAAVSDDEFEREMGAMARQGVHIPSWFRDMAEAQDLPGKEAKLPMSVDVPFGEEAGAAPAAAAESSGLAEGSITKEAEALLAEDSSVPFDLQGAAAPALFGVRMRCDFVAMERGELDAKNGNVLEIISTSPTGLPEGWWIGRLEGKEGLVPANYCKRLDEPLEAALQLQHQESMERLALEEAVLAEAEAEATKKDKPKPSYMKPLKR